MDIMNLTLKSSVSNEIMNRKSYCLRNVPFGLSLSSRSLRMNHSNSSDGYNVFISSKCSTMVFHQETMCARVEQLLSLILKASLRGLKIIHNASRFDQNSDDRIMSRTSMGISLECI